MLRRSLTKAVLAITVFCLVAAGVSIGMRHFVLDVRSTSPASLVSILPPLLPLLPPAPTIEVPTSQPSPTDNTQTGTLRVSNQSSHPVRVILRRYTGDERVPNEPIHWDFAPQEGRVRGMILSLPKEDLRLRSGDILVVFAQDGSRRYWGPYIVGETEIPLWNQQQQEWMLPIQPQVAR